MKNVRKRILAVVLAGCVACVPITGHAGSVISNEVNAETKITGLTTEYLSNPIGIETDSIHFGWKMVSNAIGAKQTAYQVKVTAPANSDSVIWDSGKIESDRSTGIVCGGNLQERTTYNWEVTVWDENEDSHSGNAFFETGVTNDQDWLDAEFIRLNASPIAPVFRTEQNISNKEIGKARLYITAMGAYEAYVNGNQVGKFDENANITYEHMNPGYGNGNVSLGYQTYDVTSFLRKQDKAAISVVTGTGWYNGMGNTTSRPAVKALMVIDYKDGGKEVIKTDTFSWKGTLEGGITGNGIFYGEDYNACFTEELGDFTQIGYDDSNWVNAEGNEEKEENIPYIENKFTSQNAAFIRILVKETGPAIKGVNEHFLQLMELELLDGDDNNVVLNKIPQISNTWSPNGQWNPVHLTDGDLGIDSEKGYTTTLLGTQGQKSFVLDEPISITFNLEETVTFEKLKMYPRASAESVSKNECANYPKKYCLQVSEDGESWTNVDLNSELSRDSGEIESSKQTKGIEWSEEHAYYVEFLRNSHLFPEINALNYGVDFKENIQAKHVKVVVNEIGPAVYEQNDYEKENRLQIMELELLDGQNNVVEGMVPTINQNFEAGAQWNAANLTDGDYGHETDAGYTTDILGHKEQFLKLEEPVTIQFNFDNPVNFSTLKIYPRISKESISYGVCANYPKVYTVQISDDGIEWKDVVTDQESGMVRNTTLYESTAMSTTTYPGAIRAQAGTSGKLIDTYDQYPVSAVLYTGVKSGSSFPGGEVDVDESYTGENIFSDGIKLNKGQTMVINMGQNLTAVPLIQYEAQKGTKATLKFAEMLNDGSSVGNGATQADGPKGSIYKKSLRGARSAATYIFNGNGKEEYQPSMSFFGYQYIELTASDDITVYGICSKAISSVTEQLGNIVTNNENVNKLFSNVLYGQLSNYYTTPTDCNQRDERLSWTGDTQAFAQTAVYNFDSMAFLKDMQDIYNENTWIKGYVPAVADIINGYFDNWAAGWSDVLIVVPWVMYMQTGDETILKDNWDTLVHYMDYMKSIERGANQAPTPDTGKNYGDWLSFQGTSIEVINDYYYGYMHQLMTKMAKIIGDTEKEQEYAQKFEAIKNKFIQTHVEFEDGELTIKSKEGNVLLQFMHWTDKKGVWENNSQTSLIWMLKLGFYDSDEMRDAAVKLLLENIKNENPEAGSIRAQYGENTLAVGFLGSNVITPLLTEIGSSDVSYDLLLQDEQPSWLFEVKAGATTVWERWNSYTPGVGFGDSEMNSFNHYAYGSVVEWMYQYMAGISADEENPGFKNVVLQPTLDTGEKYNDEDRINAVEASYESYYGTIQSNWTSEEGKLVTYSTEIPANTTATLYLPVEEAAVEGFSNINGVKLIGVTEHNNKTTAKIQLDSGSYEFEVEEGKLSVDYPGGGQTPEVTVTKVEVSPASLEVEKGKAQQLTAKVTGKNNPAQTVTWVVEGQTSQNTKISSTGLLSVGQDEKAVTITVKATSVLDETKYGKAIITVKGTGTIVDVKVNSIRVKAESNSIFIKDKTKVQATVLPSNAANKNVTWSSSNPSIATVSTDGIVTGIKKGTVTIKVAAVDGSKVYDECIIKVVKPTVKLNAKSAKLQIKKSTKVIKASGLQKGDKVVRWTSSKKSVATVNKKGTIKAKKPGTTKIKVHTKKGATATLKLTVTKKPVKTKSIKANSKKLTMKKGENYQLKVTRNPITATEKITYLTSNKNIAAVNSKGKITAKKKGKAAITIKTSNNKKATVEVNVK